MHNIEKFMSWNGFGNQFVQCTIYLLLSSIHQEFFVINGVIQNAGMNKTCLKHKQSSWVPNNSIWVVYFQKIIKSPWSWCVGPTGATGQDWRDISPTPPCTATDSASLFSFLWKLFMRTDNRMSKSEWRCSGAECTQLDWDAGKLKNDCRHVTTCTLYFKIHFNPFSFHDACDFTSYDFPSHDFHSLLHSRDQVTWPLDFTFSRDSLFPTWVTPYHFLSHRSHSLCSFLLDTLIPDSLHSPYDAYSILGLDCRLRTAAWRHTTILRTYSLT